MRTATLALSFVVLIVGTLALGRLFSSAGGMLSIVPYSLGPLFATIVLSCFLNGKLSQTILAVSSLGYGAWFAFAYYDLVYLNPDPQSPIGFLFIGAYSIPWIAQFWAGAFLLRSKSLGPQ